MRHTHRWAVAVLVAIASSAGANQETAAADNAADVEKRAAIRGANQAAVRESAAARAATPAAAQAATPVAEAAQDTAEGTLAGRNRVLDANADATATVSESIARGTEFTRRAQATTNATEKAAALREAEHIYTEVLKQDPKSGAALNNLAVLAVGKGDATAARRYFEDAIASNDGHEALYALNYSKFLEASDKPGAVKAARLAVQAAPQSTIAKTQLGTLLWQTDPAEMLPLANDFLAQGDSELATRFALQCLKSQTRPEAERRAWLILLAVRLSREYAISEEVRKSLAQDLASLEADPMIGRGAQQLRAVIETPPGSAGAVDWWAAQWTPSLDTMTGRAAMRNVLLAAGQTHSQDPSRAERYFMTAVDLGDRGPDPDAFLRLVELYASHDQSDEFTTAKQQLAVLMQRYEIEMFSEKSQAYSEGNWPQIYRMHVALGMTYAYLSVWTSEASYQNAIFQLSHAMTAAERASGDPTWNDKQLALPPACIEKLAEGYLFTGRADLALKARIDGAAALARVGHERDSANVLRTIPAAEVGTLDEASRSKYEALRSRL